MIRMIGIIGAVVQLMYGVLAMAFPYPRIADRPFEAMWAIAVAGMIATTVAWLGGGPGRPRWLGLAGGVVATTGFALRIAVSLYFVANPDAGVEIPLLVSIALMFTGLALIGVAALLDRDRAGWRQWAPIVVLAGGLVAAPLYDAARVAHFVVLGLVWGTAWLLMAFAAQPRMEGVKT